ncbi:PA2169 family four-helix-bundle protein [Flocculibacter collagenilyticus]|uniref:PA2169 family four-helix-bundle protein n=1 Tax=Flocculibacter collagenilyticus TaxID=2744479 RepID=UPI0018F4B26B|nr:PA2169 family four-helix-bundle protein [Flocculibacter collagenilyticus]
MDPFVYVPPQDPTQTDAMIVNEIIAVCHDGLAFYQHAQEHVEDYNLKRIFSGMIEIRREIIEKLEPEVIAREVSPVESESIFNKVRQWYVDAKDMLSDDNANVFIDELEQHEQATLNRLKEAMKRIEDERLAKKISHIAASVQMTHDKMAALKEQYKNN